MKSFIAVGFILVLMNATPFAQNSAPNYPEPEFMQEVYAFNKGANSLVRLEKEASKFETKLKAMGFGGSESAFNFQGDKSSVRFSSMQIPSFVFRIRGSMSSANMSRTDSTRANSNISSINSMIDDVMDPSKSIALYVLDQRSGQRSLIMQSSGGKFTKKSKTSDKVLLSFKQIRDGYYEIIVDKSLAKGEYAFMNTMETGNEATMFLFGVD